MWVNLHSLPAGQSMYTLAVTDDPVGTPKDLIGYDEVDVVAGSRATVAEIIEAAHDQLEDYPSTARIVGVSNQSDGYVMWQDADGDARA